MIQENFNSRLLGDIVTGDIRAASVFAEAGIDFCCGGKKTLEQACLEKNIETTSLVLKLQSLGSEPLKPGHNFNEWSLGFLSDYIVNTHHKYVLKTLPQLLFYTQKIAGVHGENHLELHEVAHLFNKVNTELLAHMRKEEEIVFPAIKALEADTFSTSKDILRQEIEIMLGEHEFAGELLDRIRLLTNDYLIPQDACNTYSLTLRMLKQFENDLHIHVHLENNILFPKSLKL